MELESTVVPEQKGKEGGRCCFPFYDQINRSVENKRILQEQFADRWRLYTVVAIAQMCCCVSPKNDLNTPKSKGSLQSTINKIQVQGKKHKKKDFFAAWKILLRG